MANPLMLKARIRKRDKDIQKAVELMDLEEGQMADMVRDGFRKILAEIGVLEMCNKQLATPEVARLVAKELMQNLYKKG